MALVLKESAKFYNYLFYELADDRLDYLPLTKSPIPITTLLIVYLWFVLKAGPRFMKKRKPFDLRRVLIIYNFIQMMGCGMCVIYFTRIFPFSKWKCTPYNDPYTQRFDVQIGGYIYFISKIIDLLDTVFFVLKKNYRQITFLHVFHHTTMILNVFYGIKYYPAGHGLFVPYINAIVHTVMYGYYLLTVYDEKYKKSIWWKKHITQLQLFQFGLLIILFTIPLINGCDYPKLPCVLALLFNGSMIVLFSKFYYKTYVKKNKET